MRTILVSLLGLMLSVSVGLAQKPLAPSPTFTFTSFDVPNAISSRAHRINARGQIVGRYIDSSGTHHGFLRSSDGLTFTQIDPPGAGGTSRTVARSINARGEIVGRYSDVSDVQHGFLRTPDGTFINIDVPVSFGAVATDARGINDVGEIVGDYEVPTAVGGTIFNVTHGFLRSAGGTFTKIDFPGALVSVAVGINDAGEIVGGYAFAPVGNIITPHSFSLRAGVFTSFDFPNSSGSFALAVNAPFAIVGSYATTPLSIADLDGDPTGKHGYLRSADGTTFTAVDFPGGNVVGTQARGINPSGVIVGDYSDGADHAFIATR